MLIRDEREIYTTCRVRWSWPEVEYIDKIRGELYTTIRSSAWRGMYWFVIRRAASLVSIDGR